MYVVHVTEVFHASCNATQHADQLNDSELAIILLRGHTEKHMKNIKILYIKIMCIRMHIYFFSTLRKKGIIKSVFLAKLLCSVSLCHNLVTKHLDFSPAVPLGRHIWALPSGILGHLKAAQGQSRHTL